MPVPDEVRALLSSVPLAVTPLVLVSQLINTLADLVFVMDSDSAERVWIAARMLEYALECRDAPQDAMQTVLAFVLAQFDVFGLEAPRPAIASALASQLENYLAAPEFDADACSERVKTLVRASSVSHAPTILATASA